MEHSDTRYLLSLSPAVSHVLASALKDPATFFQMAGQNKTVHNDLSFSSLLIWLQQANAYVEEKTKKSLLDKDILRHLKKKRGIDDAVLLLNAFTTLANRETKPSLLGVYPNIIVTHQHVHDEGTENAKRSKRGSRVLELNGIRAVELSVKNHTNLQEPILDVNLKLNNPIGRLWLALKRIWKSQHTVITLKFRIPLFVLPVMVFIFWKVWQGKNVSVPAAQLGIIHTVSSNGKDTDIFLTSTDMVYFLDYLPEVNAPAPKEVPVIATGTYSSDSNTFHARAVIPYDRKHAPSGDGSGETYVQPSFIQEILTFLSQFY